jgi:hypothetical protein
MTDTERHNRVNIHHHLRDDVFVLLPYVAYRNGTLGYGDGCVLARNESEAIGDAILRMLDHCETANTRPLEQARDAAMQRLREGFELTFDEQFPSFGIPDNWGRLYEQYPEILLHPLRSARYFSTADISDRNGPDFLVLEHLLPNRKEHGIYYPTDTTNLDRHLGKAVIGETIAEKLHSWRPAPGLLARLIA